MSSEFRCIQVNSKEVSRCNKILRIRDVKCVAYSKPLLGAVPTKSGAAVRIKRQQLKAETQGQNANLGHKDNMEGKITISYYAFPVNFNAFR